MTDGDSSGGTDDILPTDGAPEEDEVEGVGSDTDQEPADDSSGGGSEDIFPTDDTPREADAETADGETETIDDTGEVVIEEDASTETSEDRSKGLAELDRELEQLGSDSADADAGGAAGRAGPEAGAGMSSSGGHTEASNQVDEWGSSAGQTGQAAQRYCQECGSSISRNAEICPECGVRQSKASSDDADPGVAALLSFFVPGLGDLYSDETELGVIIFLAWLAWIGIGWFLIGGGFTILTFGLGLFLVVPVLLAIELLIHVGAAVISYSAAS